MNDDLIAVDQHYNEDAVLGAVFVQPALLPQITERVGPEDFTRPDERRVFETVCELYQSGSPCSIEDIYRAIKRAKLDLDSGWIGSLAGRASVSDAVWYATELRRLSRLSKVRHVFTSAMQRTWDANGNPDDILATALTEATQLQYSSIDRYAPSDYTQVLKDNPELNSPVIEGVLRRGETCNIIAAPKIGKSFLSVGLAWSVATGRPWLNFGVESGRVLLIDNELHKPTLTNRIDKAANEMQIPFEERAGYIDVISLRGELCDINGLHQRLLSIQPREYTLVVVDALYRTLPQGSSENDNAAMMAVYNRLDQYAARLDAAIAVVHHSSKGSQGDKGLTDVGAGAGSIARAADTHMAIRPHEEDGHAVLEAVTRSFKSPEPISIQFEYPLWHPSDLAPEVRRMASRKQEHQDKQDAEADELCLSAMNGEWVSSRQLRRLTSLGETRAERAIGRLLRKEQIETGTEVRRGREIEVFRKVVTDGPE